VTIQSLAGLIFFCGSFNNSVSDSHYTTYNTTVNNQMARMWSQPNKCTLLSSKR